MKKVLLLLLFLILFYSGYQTYFAIYFTAGRVVIDIPAGASGDAIARMLFDQGAIKNPLVFKLYLKRYQLSRQLKAGRYLIAEGADLPQIVGLITGGKATQLSVTIPEGVTVNKIGTILTQKGLTTEAEFNECLATCHFNFDFLPPGSLEGYLFPDTYFVDLNNYSDQAFLTRMIRTLGDRLTATDWQAVRSSGYLFAQIMIMASILEAEESSDIHRPLVAGILWDRYDQKIGLGADATVRYALGDYRGELSAADLAVDSPYNTRKFRGLPPTPINNPGLSSIRAALYPKRTDYGYYLHDKTGEIHYAKNLEEHNLNKSKYLE